MPPEWVGGGICGSGFFKVDVTNVLRFMSCLLIILPISISRKSELKRPPDRHTVRLSLVPFCPRLVFKIKMTKFHFPTDCPWCGCPVGHWWHVIWHCNMRPIQLAPPTCLQPWPRGRFGATDMGLRLFSTSCCGGAHSCLEY